MNRIQNHISIFTPSHKVLVWALGAVVLTLIALYFSLAVGAAVHAAENKQLDAEIPKLSTETSELEFAYISLRNDLDEKAVEEHGLTLAGDVEFISSASLGFRTFSSFEQ